LQLASTALPQVEALDRLNEQALTKKGQGLGSASERTRTSITAGLKRKLKDLMGEFSELRAKASAWGARARWRRRAGAGATGAARAPEEGLGAALAWVPPRRTNRRHGAMAPWLHTMHKGL
jgi:hypothetical protein